MLRITISIPQASRSCPARKGRIAIIGGGYTGAITAYLLAQRSHENLASITVFEPRETLGAGLAYGSGDLDLRLNVAAHRMRAVPGVPTAFFKWLEDNSRLSTDPASITRGGTFSRRRDFGLFMNDLLKPLIEAGQIAHVRQYVTEVQRNRSSWSITRSDGRVDEADTLIIATGHASPKIPDQIPASLVRSRRCIPADRLDAAISEIAPAESVLVLGTGLTALDVVASLKTHGHTGPIHLMSRSGLLPRPHASGDFAPHGVFETTDATARGLLRQVRSLVAETERNGLPWQSVMDALRHQGQAIWTQLPEPEKKRVLRHLRRIYEVHRFRMPPQVEALLDKQGSSPIDVSRGRLERVRDVNGKLEVQVGRPMGQGNTPLEVDRLVIATGPDAANMLDYQTLLRSMRDSGHLVPNALGLGIACDAHCRAVSSAGVPQASLLIAGPLTRGTFGEITGVPEIAAQAAAIADMVIRQASVSTRTIAISG
ncbi:FAD/NAD(P)-binding protein [Rhizobium wuzhouense]|uniref:Hydroxyacylglutathione hydrolase n=1 Tax=Rhizobium wuzhouense TaxID=1986026 RepID=A0ABX5NTJ1_9HYPH|nr:FAD/NAD(P)-binding protein [Rhizobium wuzhouense]PYB75313.1 hydroxyacylglutathione hydrolase [Rhizobium wuzhouense]